MAKIHKLGYQLLTHSAYPLELSPCYYFLFQNLKKWLGSKRFGLNEEVINETNIYFEKTYYLEGRNIWKNAGINVSS